jgi:hypothetical protein
MLTFNVIILEKIGSHAILTIVEVIFLQRTTA